MIITMEIYYLKVRCDWYLMKFWKIFTYSSFSRSVQKKWVTSGFGLKVIIGGSLFVSGHSTLQLYCETRSKMSWDQSDWNFCFSILIHPPIINTLEKLAEILEG